MLDHIFTSLWENSRVNALNMIKNNFNLLIHLMCINVAQIDFKLEQKAHDFAVLFLGF